MRFFNKTHLENFSKESTIKPIMFYLSYLPFFFFFFFLMGCNQSFEPIKKDDSYQFSMFGFLDASADTQWVRVTPLRPQLGQPPEKPEMHVTVVNIQSGQSIIMKDSLFLFPDDFNILNAWTTADINPDQTYRIMATTPDGGESSVTITTPQDFPVPELIVHEKDLCQSTLRIKGVKRLADVQYRWRVKVTRPGWEYVKYFKANLRGPVHKVGPDEYETRFGLRSVRSTIEALLGSLPPKNTKTQILEKQIFVAAAGPDWIDYYQLRSLNDLVYALPATISNVEKGTGYAFGIVSKTIPDTLDTQCPWDL